MTSPVDPASAPRFGAGFRSAHYSELSRAPRAVDWLEVVSDTVIGVGGARRAMLDALRESHPIALHGVGLSIAGSDPLDDAYLRGLRAIADATQPIHVSDHLCWTGVGGRTSHDLLPIAYTEEVLDHVAARVAAVQDRLGRRLVLENASAYVAFAGAQLDEGEFFAALCARTGCGMLLDVNNLFVNACNLGADPRRTIAALPTDAVAYLHLAGHAVLADVRIDTHDAAVPEEVWALYATVARRFPRADVIVEWDDALPPFAALAAEVARARALHREALAGIALPVAEPPSAPRAATRAAATRDTPSWQSLQHRFFAQLTGDPPARAALALDDILPVRVERGLRVYRDAYVTSLRGALAVNFPALARVVSAADFASLAADYLRAHPPREPSLVPLGAALAGFVRGHRFAGDYGVDRVVLAELVALEQAQLEVANAVDTTDALAPDALAAIDALQWDGARFDFAPAFRLVPVTHDVAAVVESVQRGEEPSRPAAWRGSYVVHRARGALATERIDEAQAAVLAALAAGHRFADACGALAATDDAERVTCGVRALLFACQRGLVRAARLDRDAR